MNQSTKHKISVQDIALYQKATGCDESTAKQVLKMMKPALRERALRAALTQKDFHLHDPIEDEPIYREAFAIAEAEAEIIAESKGVLGHFGWCHILWAEKTRILQEKFGITWFSLQEMNPHICFD